MLWQFLPLVMIMSMGGAIIHAAAMPIVPEAEEAIPEEA
jgi:hypothetical protein